MKILEKGETKQFSFPSGSVELTADSKGLLGLPPKGDFVRAFGTGRKERIKGMIAFINLACKVAMYNASVLFEWKKYADVEKKFKALNTSKIKSGSLNIPVSRKKRK